MSESGRNSGAFFLLGAVAFITGIVFWIVSGRAASTVSFACSSVVFAGAWLFERISRRGEEQ
ncbi:hypothetical protein ACFRMN_20250 [Streptomyces sp. NPDC056835]|uniref:hypothetical protein n=1 Tax=Streptomyces sp. NPDC056835 TaxID=3345956 RepID=UPI0036D1FDF2